MGKTETIKERRVDVYVDTFERKERWTELAEEEGESLSKFVQRCVAYTIEHGGLDYAALGEQSQKIQKLEQEVTDLRKDVKQKELVIETLETDLEEYRIKAFQEDEFDGVRQYDTELVEILKEGGYITNNELLRRLDVSPTQTDLMKAIDNQLEQLESYGLVTSNSHGWRWLE